MHAKNNLFIVAEVLLDVLGRCKMILAIGCLIIVCATTIAIVRSKKPLKLIMAEAKYEILYNAIGSKYMMQDFLMRNKNKTDLPMKTGKVAVITGGTRGIGLEVIKMLLKCDINVIIGCRDVKKGENLLSQFREQGINTGNVHVYQLDISVLDSVRKFANEVKNKHDKIDYLINNAAVLFSPYQLSADGFELQFATNYLGHFLLTHLLLPELKRAGTEKCHSRIVSVSSCSHILGEIDFQDINFKKLYIPAAGYARSKLGQILFSNYLNDLLCRENEHVQSHSVHPGVANTDMLKNTPWNGIVPWISGILKTPENAAIPIIHACLSPDLEGKGATYIMACDIIPPNKQAQDVVLQKRFFEFSKQLVHIDLFSNFE